jgi:hypothetical protein
MAANRGPRGSPAACNNIIQRASDSHIRPTPLRPQRQQHQQRGRRAPLHTRAAAAAGKDARGGAPAGPVAPWALTFDLRERETEWTEANQARLVALTAAQELGVPFDVMEVRGGVAAAICARGSRAPTRAMQNALAPCKPHPRHAKYPPPQERLDRLTALLPDIGAKLAALRPQLVAPLVRDLEQLPGGLAAPVVFRTMLTTGCRGQALRLIIAAAHQPGVVSAMSTSNSVIQPTPTNLPKPTKGRMIALRELLPAANISALVATSPQVLLRSEAELRAAVARLKEVMAVDERQASW